MPEQPAKIFFACGNCGKSIAAPAGAAGKTGRCPGCRARVPIPAAPPSAAAAPSPPQAGVTVARVKYDPRKYPPAAVHRRIAAVLDAGIGDAELAELQRLGPAAKAARPVLLERANRIEGDPDNAMNYWYPDREKYQPILDRIGPVSPQDVPDLVKLLNVPTSWNARSYAAEVLLHASPEVLVEVVPAVPTLIEVIQEAGTKKYVHRKLETGKHLIDLVTKLGPAAVPGLRLALHHPDLAVRLVAFDHLAKLDPAAVAAAVPVLVDGLPGCKNREARHQLFALLLGLGPAAAAAVPALQICLSEPAEIDRDAIATTLVKLDPEGTGGVSNLVGWLRGTDRELAIVAAKTLAIRDLPAESVVPVLIEAIHGTWKDYIVPVVLQALRRFGPTAAPAVPALIEILQNKERWAGAYRETIHVLAAIGSAAEPAIPAIVDLMATNELDVKEQGSLLSLLQSGLGPAAIPVFVEGLRSSNMEVRYQAADHLSKQGPLAAAIAVPTLTELVRDPEWAIRAVCSLGRIGPTAAAAIPALREALRSTKPRPYRRMIAEALQKIDPAASEPG